MIGSDKAGRRIRTTRDGERDCVDWVARRLAPTLRRLLRGIGDALGFDDGIFGIALFPSGADHVYFADFVGPAHQQARAPEGDIPTQKHRLHPGNALSAALEAHKNGVAELGMLAALRQDDVIRIPLQTLFHGSRIPDQILILCKLLHDETEHRSFVYLVPFHQERDPPPFWQRLGDLAPLLAQLIRSHIFVVGAAEARPRNELQALLACLPVALEMEEDELLRNLDAVRADVVRVKRAISKLEIRIGLAEEAGQRSAGERRITVPARSPPSNHARSETLDLWITAIEPKHGDQVELLRLTIFQNCTACGDEGLKLIQAKYLTKASAKSNRRTKELARNQQVLLYMFLRAATQTEPICWDELCHFLEPGFSRHGVAATAVRDAIVSRGDDLTETASSDRGLGRTLEPDDDAVDRKGLKTSRKPLRLDSETMSGIGRAAVRHPQQRTHRRLESANRFAEMQLKKVLDIELPRRKLTMFTSTRGSYRVVPSVNFDQSFRTISEKQDWVHTLVGGWINSGAL